MDTIKVSVEAEPHAKGLPVGLSSLSGEVLNRPSPQGGAFLISFRLPKEIWSKMKAAGADYFSADDLEDLDMFDSEPGWRYSLAAIKVLLAHGYALDIRDRVVTQAAELDELFSEAGKVAYLNRIRQERENKERLEAEARQCQEASVERKRQEYEAWKREHLAGLVQTFANDNRDMEELKWQRIEYFDESVGWYTTGDSWYVAEKDGHQVYKCCYGNAAVCHAPQSIVDRWCEAHWTWLVSEVYNGDAAVAARKILVDSLRDYIGSDIAKRLIEIHGADHYVKLATSVEWWIFGNDSLGWETGAAEHYGAEYEKLKSIKASVYQYKFHLPSGGMVQSYWRHPDGSIIAKGYHDSEYAIVTIDQLPDPLKNQLFEAGR